MALKVLYDDKVAINSNAGIPDINKIKDLDMNNIKSFLLSGWNLIEGVTFTFSSWDSTVSTLVVATNYDLTPYVGLGNKLKYTHSSATKYAIVTAITSTTMKLYLGTDYTVSSGNITNVYFSKMKTPTGFPMNPDKWTIKYEASSRTAITNPVKDNWYNLATLNLPIGVWNVIYNSVVSTTAIGAAPNRCYISIGTVSASQGSAGWMSGVSLAAGTNNKIFNLTSPSTMYLTFMTSQPASVMFDAYASGIATTIRAVCAYL